MNRHHRTSKSSHIPKARSRKAARERNWLSVERLEERALLTGYTNFGTFLSGVLAHLQTDSVGSSQNPADLPVIGNSLATKAAAKGLLPSGSVPNSLADDNALSQAVKSALGINTTVSFDGNKIHITSISTVDVAVPQLDLGLDALKFSTSQGLMAHATSTIDLTIISSGGSSYQLDTTATNHEFDVNVYVKKSDVPEFDLKLGPLFAHATPLGNDPQALFLGAHYTIDVTGQPVTSNGNTVYPVDEKIGGSANLSFQLTAGFLPSGQPGFNPKITSQLVVNWAFGDANHPDHPGNKPISQLGERPTVEFRDVTLDLGAIVQNLGGSTLSTILDKAQPVFALAQKLDSKIPVLSDLSDQIKGLIGNNGTTGIDVIDKFIGNPTLLGLLDTMADIPLPDKTPEDSAAIHQFVALVREVEKFGQFYDAIKNANSLTIDFGSYSFGGGSDIRGAGESLLDQPSNKTAPGTPINQQNPSGDPVAFLFNTYHLKSDLLSDPLAPIKLLLGSPTVSLLEYQDKIVVGDHGSFPLLNENFVIGVVPANFQIDLTLPSITFNIDVGFDSRGLLTGKIEQGLFVVAGGADPLMKIADLGLSFNFGIGNDWGAIDARAGVSAELKAKASIDFLGSGHTHLDEIDANCPMTGNLTVAGSVNLFADTSLNLDLKALLQSLKVVVELAVVTNPYVLAAKAFINNPEVVHFLNKNLGVSSADIANIQNLVNTDHPLDAIAKGFDDLKVPTSQDFKDVAKHVQEEYSKQRDKVLQSNPVIAGISKGATDLGTRAGIPKKVHLFSLLSLGGSYSTSTPLVEKTILSWDFMKGCRAVDGGGSSINNTASSFVPELGSLVNGVLTLYVGPLASNRNFDDGKNDPNEVATIRPADPANPKNHSIIVTIFGYSRKYDGVNKVVADGGDGNDTIDASGAGVDVNFSGGTGNDLLIAGLGTAVLHGNDDNDTLIGGPSNDSLFGEAGNDLLTGAGGDDYLDGGSGNDTLNGDFSEGSPSDTSPSPSEIGNDTLVGGTGDDWLYGGPGDDVAYGNDGNDTVRGGLGNDSLYGNNGDDLLNGGAGNDSIDGGAGTDTLFGSSGDDLLIGGAITDATDDVLVGDADNDTLLGTAGNNYLFGGSGNDRLYGYDGNDYLEGDSGDDTLNGGAGNDIITGDTGNDFIDAGDGSDRIFYLSGDGQDILEGGSGQNVLDFGASSGVAGQFDAVANGTRLALSLGGILAVDAADIQQVILDSGGEADTFHVGDLTGTGVSLVTVLLSSSGASTVTLDGTAHADSVVVSPAGPNGQNVSGLPAQVQVRNSHKTGDSGDVLAILGLGGDDLLVAQKGAENDIGIKLDGGDGNDILSADATLLGGAGDDTIIPLAGNNVVDGGAGFDTILVPGSADDDLINVSGPASNLVISQTAGGLTTASTNIVSNVERISVTGQDGNDTITLAGLTIPTIVDAGAGNDKVDASGVTAVAVTLLGGDGDDILTGGTKADRIEGGDGNDVITGGPGNDSLFGGDGSDTIVWNEGDGSDLIEGGTGTNALVVNGSTSGDAFDITANGARLSVKRTNLTAFALDIAGIQQLTINGGAGPDTIHAADLTGTDLRTALFDLGANDGAQDIVILDGRQVADNIAIAQAAQGVDVDGLPVRFAIRNTSSLSDVLDVRGFGGDDRIEALSGSETQIGLQLEGGVGNDLLIGDGTLLGNAGDDTLIGGSANDTLIGGAGNDSISGGAGNDLILGDGEGTGVGNTFAIVAITSGQGADTLDGGAGDDTINGDAGNDSILGGDGNDLIGPITIGAVFFDEAGDDFIDGGSGNDTIHGAGGNDSILGGDGNDSLFGDAGDDTIRGGAGNDTINGGDGNDLIFGDAGDDTIHGDAGNDTINGGDGNDLIFGDAGNDSIHGDAGNDSILGGDGNDSIFGDAGDDTIHGDAGNDSLNGGDGNDLIFGDAGNDWASGDAGNDFIAGGDGDDTIDGGIGNDTLLGGAGNDLIGGGAGDDLLLGDADALGNTTLLVIASGQGNDTLDGGAGNDTLNGDAGNDSILGGDGNDLIAPLTIGALFFSEDGNDTIDAGAGDDTVHGGNGNDLIFGGLGNDLLFGDAGNDSIHGGFGADTILGGDGDDQIFGDEDNDLILAEAGNDLVDGGSGNDIVLGGDGNDSLSGGSGNDWLDGGAGQDLISGGDGNDTLIGQAGDDTLYGDGGNDILLGGVGNDVMNGGDGDDQIWGEAGNDTIAGGNGNDTLVGGDGNDAMNGGDGNDLLFGDNGNDTLLGGLGNDILYGGEGNDYLHGGTGIPNIPHTVRDPSLPNDGDDVLVGGNGADSLDGGNGNNILDAGDDGIAETVLAGTGNDIAFGHWDHDGNRDVFGLDGGSNRVYVQGGISDLTPAAPSTTTASFIVSIPAPSGRYVVQPGDPNNSFYDPLPAPARRRFPKAANVVLGIKAFNGRALSLASFAAGRLSQNG